VQAWSFESIDRKSATTMPRNPSPLSAAQQQIVETALSSLTFLKLVARVQGVAIAKLSKRDLEDFVRAAERAKPPS
jgi:hypothetical protein